MSSWSKAINGQSIINCSQPDSICFLSCCYIYYSNFIFLGWPAKWEHEKFEFQLGNFITHTALANGISSGRYSYLGRPKQPAEWSEIVRDLESDHQPSAKNKQPPGELGCFALCWFCNKPPFKQAIMRGSEVDPPQSSSPH